MAKSRVMIYHHAGADKITVETIVRADVDGESLEKSTNLYASGKPVLDCLAQLYTLIDAELGLAGEDAVTAEKFAPVADAEVAELDQTP